MSDQMQRDIAFIEGIVDDYGLKYHIEAWKRIRASLSPDRERVARAICKDKEGDDEDYYAYLKAADAAIKVMQATKGVE